MTPLAKKLFTAAASTEAERIIVNNNFLLRLLTVELREPVREGVVELVADELDIEWLQLQSDADGGK